jgi:hypothetical protein
VAEAAQFQGTRSAPARRRLRRTAALLAGAPLLAALMQIPAAPTAQAAPGAAGSRTVDVSIDSMTPAVPSKDDTITVSGTVTNDGDATVSDARVGLRVGPTLNSRSAIDSAADRKGFVFGAEGHEADGNNMVKIDELPTGLTRAFTLNVPVEDLDLGDSGVYQLGVSLTGRTAGQPFEQVLGIERTFLPWQPSVAGKKTQISFLWPLISDTRLTARTDSDPQQTPIFQNDDLTEELASGGRLQQLVAYGAGLPVTWVIDPDLLATVEAMTKSYQVQGPGGTTTVGKNQAIAQQWLGDLQRAIKGRQVVALPFADPDLASIAHRGKNVSGALSHLRPATELASTTVESILGRKPRTDFAWPVNGAIDSSIVDVATSAGAHNVITRSDSLRETGRLPYTPTAARPIGGGNTAIVSDTRLSTAFQGDMTRAENSTLAVQMFLAQTQMITLQAPGRQRSIVIAPQRMPSVSQARTMADALQALEPGRWSSSLDLGQAAKAKPDQRANRQVPGGGAYPSSLRRQELPTTAFEEIRRTQGALSGFEVILSQSDRVVTPFGNAIMREMSVSWRGDATGAQDFRNTVQGYLSQLTREVKLIQKSTQTLSGRSATIPVTVQNNLVQGIEGMTLVLTSSQPNRLTLDKPQQPVEVQGGHSQSVKFTTTANANGPVRVRAQLYTEDGTAYGEPMTFQVNVTEITSTVMLVIAGGVLLLVLAGIRMYTQRKRAAARDSAAQSGAQDALGQGGGRSTADEPVRGEGADEPGTAEGPAGSQRPSDGAVPPGGATAPPSGEVMDGDAPERLSEATSDTGPDSTNPSGRGEKVER